MKYIYVGSFTNHIIFISVHSGPEICPEQQAELHHLQLKEK